MSSTIHLDRLPARLGFVPTALVNLLPLVGVLRFGWDPTTLLVVYALELVISLPLAGAAALFAERPPRPDRDGSTVIDVSDELSRRRGSVQPTTWLPPVYPRNLPFAAAVGYATVLFGIVLLIAFSNVSIVATALGRPDVIGSTAALVVGGAVETWRERVRGDRRDASPYAVIETPARQALFVVFVLLVVAGFDGVGPLGVLVGLVVGKLLVEWSGYRAGRSDGGWLTGWLSGPETVDPESDTVPIPEGDPDIRVPTDDRAVLYTGVLDVVGRLAPFVLLPFAFLWFAVLSLLGDAPPAATIGSGLAVVGLLVGYLALHTTTFYLRYAPLEYRRYGDRLVAYDTLVDEPQWTSPIEVLYGAEVVTDRLPDRLLGTRTVAVTTGPGDGNTTRYLGPVRDHGTLVSALDLPVTTDLEPLDRRPVAVVITCLVGAVAAVAALAVGPWVPSAEVFGRLLVYGPFAVPTASLPLRFVWNRAYPA